MRLNPRSYAKFMAVLLNNTFPAPRRPTVDPFYHCHASMRSARDLGSIRSI
jgi:hypothetical protein